MPDNRPTSDAHLTPPKGEVAHIINNRACSSELHSSDFPLKRDYAFFNLWTGLYFSDARKFSVSPAATTP